MAKASKRRLLRIQSIDEKQLEVATNELRKANQILDERQQIRELLQVRLANSLGHVEGGNSLGQQNHVIEWASQMQSQLTRLDDHLKDLAQRREVLLERVRQQRAKVKGWQLLIEKIDAEEKFKSMKEAMFIADDRFLGSAAIRNGSTQ